VKIKYASTALALFAGVLLATSTAQAGRPLDVDCDLLSSTNDAVNVFLDGEGIQFDSVGDLFSSAIVDDAVFELLRSLVLFFSGGDIDFQTASQAITTNAACGLLKDLINNVND